MSELEEAAVKAVRSLPEGTDLDDFIQEIIFQAKIDEGLADSRAGRTFSIEQVEEHFNIKR